MLRAVRSIQRCDVGLLVVDAHEGATAQDAHVAGLVLEAGKGIVVLANKWDMLQDPERRKEVDFHLERVLHFPARGAVSAHVRAYRARCGRRASAQDFRCMKSGKRAWRRVRSIGSCAPGPAGVVRRAARDARRDSSTPRKSASARHPSSRSSRGPKTCIPRMCAILENGLREAFGFDGTPIVIRLRPS